jgi:glycosyltransferase involved in cell wall biosynthesis
MSSSVQSLSTCTTGETSAPKPLLSVLICTRNRALILADALRSLLSQSFDLGDFEIIVIDNASTDGTRQLVEDLAAREKRVRYVHEARLGVAKARNRGAREARGLYFAYFDDDITAEPFCLQNLVGAFFHQNPKPAAVMGKIDLNWAGGRPASFPAAYEPLLSRFDRGDEPRFMGPADYLLTTNVAFETKIFLESGGVREDLGRVGGMLLGGEDNEIFRRYLHSELRVFYEPRAVAKHLVPESRQRRGWLLKRIFAEGTSQSAFNFAGASRSVVLRRALYDGKLAAKLACSYLRQSRRDPDKRQELEFQFVQRLGQVFGDLQLVAGVRNLKTFSE